MADKLPIWDKMTCTPLTDRGEYTYQDAATGQGLGKEKPEEMTHLWGNHLVSKTHPRILFRGKVDSLMAAILEAQVLAHQRGNTLLREQLGEVLSYLRLILGAEVKESPLLETSLLGLNEKELRQISHNVKERFGIDHPIPVWEMGELPLRLNTLRAYVRETELVAVVAFGLDSESPRSDIIRAMNRLSSALYILFCMLVAQERNTQ